MTDEIEHRAARVTDVALGIMLGGAFLLAVTLLLLGY
ncbi:hypothetical protein MTDSW087_02471 [Methylobacterium dankookense]|uniref:Uncharacterized protein n=1 Tax=Methylobacterium dankookense TaxID=560405 RepID=A0A564FYC1_9HYPH|nr:hypothetical protein IFDJLNFL_0295 [Methylobacterium dankookense]VUF12776.1 hypothetical protein MTDSW087_02471 [Methylobacterium dankookense]